MPRTSKANSAVDEAAVVNTTAATNTADENKEKMSAPLKDTDEINVVSIIPNVYYFDKHTGDFYTWEEVGHVEPMRFSVLNDMWRGHKGFLKDMMLRPMDERVVNRFGLEKTYETFDFLMSPKNYKRANVNLILTTLKKSPNGLKFSIVNKIKSMITDGELNDAHVIRALEKHFDIDLMSLL